MTLLNFIFQDIWHFLGVAALLIIVLDALVNIVSVLFCKHGECELDPNDVIDIVLDDLKKQGPITAKLRQTVRLQREIVG